MKNIFLSFLIFGMISCGHQQNQQRKEEQQFSQEYSYLKSELEMRPDKNDPISVNISVLMAYNAFIRGCMDQYTDKKRKFKECGQQAKKYIKSHITDILDQ